MAPVERKPKQRAPGQSRAQQQSGEARRGEQPLEPPSARSVASRVLERVWRDGAFAAAALDAEIGRFPQLSGRDRALATELVYGTLRCQRALEQRVREHAKKLDKQDVQLLAQLLIATYQLLLLDRIPAHAAVDSAVESLKRARGPKVAGFVNAVLRKVAAGPKLDPRRAAFEGLPSWLQQSLEQSVGRHEAEFLAAPQPAFQPEALPDEQAAKSAEPQAAPRPQSRGPLGVRLRLQSGPEAHALPEWLARAPRGSVSGLARRPGSVGNARRLEGFSEGKFIIQEEGAQAIALALGVQPGDRVLDVCAGRGQKTSLLADLAFSQGKQGEVWASDVHPNKLDALAAEFERLGLPPVSTRVVDWSVGAGDIPGGFDRILVDAPCSGVGTLRRRPEIALRLKAEDPARLAELQLKILRNAATRLKPGGTLVYAVCSVLRAECEGVLSQASAYLKPKPFVQSEWLGLLNLTGLQPDAWSFRLLPSQHDTDGYFVASLTRADLEPQ